VHKHIAGAAQHHKPEAAGALLFVALHHRPDLIDIQGASQPGVLPDYDRALLARELALFPDWYVARHLGIDLKEFTLIPAGLDTERIASVMSGVIDATYLSSSAAPLGRRAGLVEHVSLGDLGVEVQGNGFATSRAYIANNRDVVRSALRGFVEAIYFVYGNKAATQKVFAKYMRTNDPAVLEDSYNGYIKSIPKKPYPTLKGIQFMLDVLAPTLPNAKNFKPEQFVDLSFLQEMEKDGFFNEMAKRYPVK